MKKAGSCLQGLHSSTLGFTALTTIMMVVTGSHNHMTSCSDRQPLTSGNGRVEWQCIPSGVRDHSGLHPSWPPQPVTFIGNDEAKGQQQHETQKAGPFLGVGRLASDFLLFLDHFRFIEELQTGRIVLDPSPSFP